MADTNLENKVDDIIGTPKTSKVFLINDDYTTFDHVVYILINVFGKTYAEAESITIQVHNQGKGLAGEYAHDVAVTKAKRVRQLSRAKGYPLAALVERN